MSSESPDMSSQILPRKLGAWDAVAVVVGSIIGSGIFVKEGTVAAQVGCFAPILSIWLIVGVVTWCGALAVAELGAMFPQAGGPYVYLREAYGPLPAFLWGWAEFWIVRTGSVGSLACGTVIYLQQIVELTHSQQWVVACGLILMLAAVNVRGVRWSAAVQNITTVVKVGFLLALIGLPWIMGKVDAGNLSPLQPPAFDFGFWKVVGLAMIAVMWPYDGWVNLGAVAEEVREPQRNVPFAFSIGLAMIVMLYLGVVLSYHLVLPFDQVAGNSRVAASVIEALFGPVGAIVMAVGVMFSTAGACNSNMLSGPRIYFAIARDGLLPKAVSRIHPRYQTPANAVWLQTVWAILLLSGAFLWKSPTSIPAEVAFADTVVDAAASPPVRPATLTGVSAAFDELTDFVIFGGNLFYAMAVAAVFVLRRTRPDLPRPYRTWGYPITPLVYLTVFAAVLTSLLVEKPMQTLFGTGLIAAGAVYYVWASRRRVLEFKL